MDENGTEQKSPFISNNYFAERSIENNNEADSDTQGILGGEISADLGFGNLAAAKEYAEQYNSIDESEQEDSKSIKEE
jgi:hypothetical protein